MRIGSAEQIASDNQALQRESHKWSHEDRVEANSIRREANSIEREKLTAHTDQERANLAFRERDLAQRWEEVKARITSQEKISDQTTRNNMAMHFLDNILSPFRTTPMDIF